MTNAKQAEPLNIFQRINKVQQNITYLKKDLTVQGYQAVSHDAVTATLRAEMVRNGIVLTVNQLAGLLDEREQGSKMRMYRGQYAICFHNMDDISDKFTINVHSHALDNGDKAPGKAMSYATKYALLKTFMIETGENEESRTYDPAGELITAHEVIELQELLKEADKKEQDMLEYFNKKGFNYNILDQMSNAVFVQTKALLKNAIQKAKDNAA